MKALRNVGVDSVHDLITFDFRSYFAKSIVFYEIDLERLGRGFLVLAGGGATYLVTSSPAQGKTARS